VVLSIGGRYLNQKERPRHLDEAAMELTFKSDYQKKDKIEQYLNYWRRRWDRLLIHLRSVGRL
jgi:hypothetical protein